MKVSIRVKPIISSKSGTDDNDKASMVPPHDLLVDRSLKTITMGSSTAATEANTISLKSYSNVFDGDSSQIDVYNSVAKDMVSSFLEHGCSVTILAYGQTGSGKTHTMIGRPGSLTEANLAACNGNLPVDWGIFPRMANELLQNLKKIDDKAFITATAVEVYFNDVFDLCNGRGIVQLKSAMSSGQRVLLPGIAPSAGGSVDTAAARKVVHPSSCYCRMCYNTRKAAKEMRTASYSNGQSSMNAEQAGNVNKTMLFAIQGQVRVPLYNLHDIVKLARLVEIERTSKSHELNSTSSRSHCIITLQIAGTTCLDTLNQRFAIVDLAGSERVEKSKVSGMGLGQAISINESLSALGRVLKAIKRKDHHVPFRDSVLTKILGDSLTGGNALMGAVVCVSGEAKYFDETACSIKFGVDMGFSGKEDHTDVAASYQMKQKGSLGKQVDKHELQQRLGTLKEKLDQTESDHFGPTATASGMQLFYANKKLLMKLENELSVIKVQQKENPNPNMALQVEKLVQQRNATRDVIERQKTIKGFYLGPSKSYLNLCTEIRDLEAALGIFGRTF